MATETHLDKRTPATPTQCERLRPGPIYVPNVDILETDDRLLLVADLPGVRPEDLDISYERGELTLTGRVEPRPRCAADKAVLCEYGVGDFYRAFQIGEGVDASKIDAELKDGVLTLHLPKTPEATPRKIAVKAN
jgi:HSP20 family molecular chaperone IbpA